MSSDDVKNRYSGRDGSKYSGKDGARRRDDEGSGYEDIGNKGSKYSGSYWDDRERSEFAHEIGFEAESFETLMRSRTVRSRMITSTPSSSL